MNLTDLLSLTREHRYFIVTTTDGLEAAITAGMICLCNGEETIIETIRPCSYKEYLDTSTHLADIRRTSP